MTTMKTTNDQNASTHTKKIPNPWYLAKDLLTADYIGGVISDDMSDDEIRKLKPEYENVREDRFKANWKNLKKKIDNDFERSEIENSMFFHDLSIYTLAKDIDGEWHGSDAERLLKRDVAKGRHKRMRPEFLQLTRPEYQEFDLDLFRKHIYQESRGLVESNYWLVKKKKKEKKKAAKREGRKYQDDDNDFYDQS